MSNKGFTAHINTIHPGTSSERQAALMQMMTTAIPLSNQARNLSVSGDHRGAIRLHQRALEIKVRAHGIDSVQAALTFNALGEEYLAVGELEDAEAALKHAKKVREAASGQEFDAAVTRENLGRVYEKKGDWKGAKAIREGGGNHVTCSNENCPGETFAYSALKRCSACQAPWYCTASCQKADWVARHKVLCQSRTKAA